MSYRDKTPQVLSVLTRKLRPGKTFEDFQNAHLPLGKVEKDTFGYNVDYFDHPTRVINAISITDPTIIISIGLTYGDVKSIATEAVEKINTEIERRNQIDMVAEKLGTTQLFLVASDNNFGGKDPKFIQRPLENDPKAILDIINKKNNITKNLSLIECVKY
jgi:hypothetical protein